MTEMEKMQAEAANNARAMYRRRTPAKTVTIPQQIGKPPENEPPKPDVTNEIDHEITDKKAEPMRSDILSSLFEDKERTLIILLIILLSEDGADTGAILALMYCIL